MLVLLNFGPFETWVYKEMSFELESGSTESKSAFLCYRCASCSTSDTKYVDISFLFSLAPFPFAKLEATSLGHETSSSCRYSCCNGMWLSSNFIKDEVSLLQSTDGFKALM